MLYRIALPLFILCFATKALANQPETTEASIFRFNLSAEPSHADPARINSSESNYFLMNLHRGLYVLSATGQPIPEIAESCRATGKKKYRCAIKKEARWSDGKSITSDDVVNSWRRLAGKNAKGVGIQILANVKNAMASHRGDVEPSEIGIRSLDSLRLEIELQDEDSDFLAKLAHPALSITRSGFELNRDSFKASTADESKAIPVSGPYKMKDWSKSNRIRLTPNPYYLNLHGRKTLAKPDVEILIVDDDETAFNLYREGTLSFLRRLPTHYLKDWQRSKELHQIPVIRFDYIGFGPELKEQKSLRKALSNALKYDELKRLYSALGVPGCPGILPGWMTKVPCHTFQLKKAEAEFSKVAPDWRTRKIPLGFSKLGGDDIQKGMEWVQAQWKSHLKFEVELRPTEQGVYVNQLRTNPPPIFRKGVGLDRASCLAALEVFTREDPENYIRFDDEKYEGIVRRLRQTAQPLSVAGRRLCTEGVKILIEESAIIPLGQIHFSILAKPEFSGWVLTPLNQLDLGLLQFARSDSK